MAVGEENVNGGGWTFKSETAIADAEAKCPYDPSLTWRVYHRNADGSGSELTGQRGVVTCADEDYEMENTDDSSTLQAASSSTYVKGTSFAGLKIAAWSVPHCALDRKGMASYPFPHLNYGFD